jgi:hypothetical protein
MKSLRSFPAGVLAFAFCILSPTLAWGHSDRFPSVAIVSKPADGGIREEIPKKYRERFEKWKADLLSTEFGRRQWQTYAANRSFVLKIKISTGKGKGAETDEFRWDEEGNFVAATITLGPEIDEGYPGPFYYPVLNSLSSSGATYTISGRILAATKLSHEIGHVGQIAKANLELIEKQSKLIPQYTSIFLRNGHDAKDSKLLELEQEIGGTPIEIWEDREYWSEVTAMHFLKERIRDEPYFCAVFNKIRNNVETYALEYSERFTAVAGRDAYCSY